MVVMTEGGMKLPAVNIMSSSAWIGEPGLDTGEAVLLAILSMRAGGGGVDNHSASVGREDVSRVVSDWCAELRLMLGYWNEVITKTRWRFKGFAPAFMSRGFVLCFVDS